MANFYSIITNRGKELEAEALASGSKITLVKFVVGDGNGQATPPKPTQTKLVNEKYRGEQQKQKKVTYWHGVNTACCSAEWIPVQRRILIGQLHPVFKICFCAGAYARDRRCDNTRVTLLW